MYVIIPYYSSRRVKYGREIAAVVYIFKIHGTRKLRFVYCTRSKTVYSDFEIDYFDTGAAHTTSGSAFVAITVISVGFE